jgi:hypothetical protein
MTNCSLGIKQQSLTHFDNYFKKLLNDSFNFGCTWWRIVKKRVMRTKLDIYVFILVIKDNVNWDNQSEFIAGLRPNQPTVICTVYLKLVLIKYARIDLVILTIFDISS